MKFFEGNMKLGKNCKAFRIRYRKLIFCATQTLGYLPTIRFLYSHVPTRICYFPNDCWFSLFVSPPPLSIIHTSYSLIPMVDIEIQMALIRERDSSSKNKRRLVIPQGPNENFWTYNDDGLARIKFLLKFVKYFIIVFSKSFLYQYVIFGKLSFQREGEGGSGWLSMRFEVN